MRYLWLVGLSLVSFNAYAVCPAAPVGAAADPVLQMRLNADAKAAYGPSNVLSSIEEGALVWDDTANAVAYCDGTNWVTLGSGGSDNLGNHTATQALAMGAHNITGTGGYTGGNLTATTSTGIRWESGVNALTHNDGGGNVQMRLGHDYTSTDERFTHAGGAAVITSNIDATANTNLTFKVSSNPGAGNDQPVVWGSSLVLTPTDITLGGISLLPTSESDPQVGTLTNGNFCTTDGTVVNCTTAASSINADTVDSLHAASFLRADADDSTTGNLGFTSGHGKGLRFWNSDSYKIYMSSVADATWGGRVDTTSDYNMYFRMNGGTNRGFVFRNNTTNVAQIDAAGNLFITGNLEAGGGHIKGADRVFLANKEPSNLTTDGELAFDSSRGLILYRTQEVGDEAGDGAYTVLDTSNISAGAGITITNTAANTAGTEAITIATSNVNAATVDSLDSTAFIRADANDNVSGHTEWQDGFEARFGNSADFRIEHDGTNHVMRGYTHGVPVYIQAEDNGGTVRNLFLADPDGNTYLYHAGTERLRTTSAGVRIAGRITNLTDPTGNQDAATKAYVDANSGGGSNCSSATYTCGACSVASGTLNHSFVKKVTCSTSNADGRWMIQCQNGSLVSFDTFCDPDTRGSCFTFDTKVAMADGTFKEIHDVRVGDKLISQSGEESTVLALDRPLLYKGKNQQLIRINGDKEFMTDNHPVMTTTGWKAVNPSMAEKESYDDLKGAVTKLEIGDEIVLAEGRLKVESIELVPQAEQDVRLYNLHLDGDNTYYANGMLVHGSAPDAAGRYPLAKDHDGEPESK